MANDDFDWDGVLVTNKLDSKEVEISFKRIDADAGLGNTPGTPPGTTEDPDGCKLRVRPVSDDTFSYTSFAPYYAWLVFSNQPTEYMKIEVEYVNQAGCLNSDDGDFSAGTYTVEIFPTTDYNQGGFYGLKLPSRNLGNIQGKIDQGCTDGNIGFRINSIDGLDVTCWDGFGILIDFDSTPATVDPEGDNGGGPVDPPTPDPDCQPGGDCTSRWKRTESLVGDYDSILFLREGFSEATSGFGFIQSYDTAVTGTSRGMNCYVLENEDRSAVLFDGNATSTWPGMDGQEGGLQMSTRYCFNTASSVGDPNRGRFYRGASPTNAGTNDFYRSESADGLGLKRCRYDNGSTEGCDNLYFMALDFNSAADLIIGNENKLINEGTSMYTGAAHVPNPRNVPTIYRQPNGSGRTEQWVSKFVLPPHLSNRGSNPAHVITSLNPSDTSYPLVSHIATASYCKVDNARFGGNQFTQLANGETGGRLQIDWYDREFKYQGASGAGGATNYLSKFTMPESWWSLKQGYWVTCRYEHDYAWDYYDTDEFDLFGLYSYGIITRHMIRRTYFINGKQVTPRFISSNFTRPSGYDSSLSIEDNRNNGVEFDNLPNNTNFVDENGLPFATSGRAEATWHTPPISMTSQYDPTFDFTQDSPITPYANFVSWAYDAASSGYFVPTVACVDHSGIGTAFWTSDQYAAMLTTFDKSTPDYCVRIP